MKNKSLHVRDYTTTSTVFFHLRWKFRNRKNIGVAPGDNWKMVRSLKEFMSCFKILFPTASSCDFWDEKYYISSNLLPAVNSNLLASMMAFRVRSVDFRAGFPTALGKKINNNMKSLLTSPWSSYELTHEIKELTYKNSFLESRRRSLKGWKLSNLISWSENLQAARPVQTKQEEAPQSIHVCEQYRKLSKADHRTILRRSFQWRRQLCCTSCWPPASRPDLHHWGSQWTSLSILKALDTPVFTLYITCHNYRS